MSATLQLTTGTQPELGPDVEVLRLDVEPLSDTVLRLKLTDAAAPRWEVPTWLFAQSSLLSGSRGAGAGAGSTPQFRVAVREAPFSLEVSRAGSDGAALFNTTGTRGLVYKVRRHRCGPGCCLPDPWPASHSPPAMLLSPCAPPCLPHAGPVP